MFAGFRPAERVQGGRLMVEQRAPPPVERPDRGNPRRCTSQLAAEMFQHPGRDDLDRIERAAGHFEEADLKGERQPVQHGPPSSDGRKLVFAQREEVLDLPSSTKRREIAPGRDIDVPIGSSAGSPQVLRRPRRRRRDRM